MYNYHYLSYSTYLEEACFRYEVDGENKELRFSKHDIQDAWIKRGGSFLNCLGYALMHADPLNARRIIDEFQDYIIQFYIAGILGTGQNKN